MAEERQILLELEVDKKGAQKSLEENAELLELNKAELSNLNKEYKQGNISVDQYAKAKLQLTQENKRLNSQNRELVKTLNTEENSLNALRIQLSKLTKERNNTNQSTKEGQERFEQLQKQILETTTAIKGQEQAGGDFRRNVGNYGDALKQNIPLLDEYAMKLQGFKQGLVATQQGLGATTKGLTGSAKALKIFRLALVSTGIGAIVVALGSLITFLTSTQRGIDAVTKVTRPLQQIFQRLIGVVQDLGGEAFDALSNAIQNPIQALKDLGQLIVDNIINRFKSLQVFGEAISELFAGNFSNAAKLAGDAVIQLNTGITDGTDKLKQFGDDIVEFGEDAINAGTKIDELTKSIERQEVALIRLEGTNERIFEQSKEIAENTENDIQSRISAAREALRVQTELEEARIALLDQRIELKILENKANDTLIADDKELAELEKQRSQAAAEAAGKRTSVNNLLNTLLKEQQKTLEESLETERLREQQTEIARLQSIERIGIARNENEQIKKLTFDSAKAAQDAQRIITESQREQSRIRQEIQALENEITLNATAQLAGAVSGLLDENTAAYKATASIEAAISTYLAITKTLAEPTLPFPANVITASAIGVQGFANVAKINGLFGGGGGANASQGQTTSQPRIDTRSSLSGAFDRNQLTGSLNQQQAQTDQLSNTVRNMPAPIVKVTDINKTQKRKSQVTVNSGL